MKICSLVPSGTEILFALGLGDQVAGVTEFCDYPPEALGRAVISRARVDTRDLRSSEIHELTKRLDASGHGTYLLDFEWMEREKPDLVLTQRLCRVCDVDCEVVEDAIASLEPRPRLLYHSPECFGDVFESILAIARVTDTQELARRLLDDLRARVQKVERDAAGAVRREVCQLEWLDPLAAGGHWFPELVEMAGGVDVLNRPGQPSRPVLWERIRDADPEVIILAPCSFGVAKTLLELPQLAGRDGWWDLQAVKSGQVYVVDDDYFTRPGPRLVDGLEIMARVLHPSTSDRAVPETVAVKGPAAPEHDAANYGARFRPAY